MLLRVKVQISVYASRHLNPIPVHLILRLFFEETRILLSSVGSSMESPIQLLPCISITPRMSFTLLQMAKQGLHNISLYMKDVQTFLNF